MHHLTDRIFPRSLLNQSWSTGWNEKWFNGFTMKDRSDDPSSTSIVTTTSTTIVTTITTTVTTDTYIKKDCCLIKEFVLDKT